MSTVLKAAAAYLVVLLAMRLLGRRAASQQAPFDMVVLFLIGGMTTTAILGEDRSFTAAMTGVFTVGLMHFAVSWLKLRSKLVERIVDGTPITVLAEGEWLPEEAPAHAARGRAHGDAPAGYRRGGQAALRGRRERRHDLDHSC